MLGKLCVGALLVTTVIAALSGGAPASNKARVAGGIPPGPIVIGMPIALTGVIQQYDRGLRDGAQLAVSDINKRGGVKGHKLSLITADTTSDIAQGKTAALQVIGRGAKFIIPTLDYNYGGGAARLANSKKLLAISAAGDLRFGRSIGPYVFNLYPGAQTFGAALARHARETLKWKTAYRLIDPTLSEDTNTCDGFQYSFEALGGKVVGSDQFQQKDQSIASQVTRLRSTPGVDGVILCSYPPGGASALRQIRSGGITVPILLGSPFDSNAWESGVPNLGEVYIASLGPITPGQARGALLKQVLARAYKLAAGKQTYGPGIIEGYSAVQALAKGIATAGSVNSARVKAVFETFKNVPFIIGPTTWSRTCHARVGAQVDIVTVEGGVEKYVTTVTPLKVSPKPPC